MLTSYGVGFTRLFGCQGILRPQEIDNRSFVHAFLCAYENNEGQKNIFENNHNKKQKFMKKTIFLFTILLIVSVSVNAQDQNPVASLARKYSSAMAEKLMKEISPNTGKNSDYDLDYESIIYDSYANEIECLVHLTWDAKKTMLFSDYKQCAVDGKLYIYLDEKDKYGNIKTKFVPKWQNEHAKDCAASHGWNVAAALTYYLSTQ